MPKVALSDAVKGKGLSPGDQIVAIAKGLQNSAPAKSAHLVNLALATMKYLMVNAESDDIRYQAATALLALPPMQAKLGIMRHVVDQPLLGRDQQRPAIAAKRLRKIMDQSPDAAKRVLEALAQAENEAQAAPDPQQKAA